MSYSGNSFGGGDSLRTAIALDSSYSLAHRLLGIVLSHSRRHEDAIWAVRPARELDPPDFTHRALLAQIAFNAAECRAAGLPPLFARLPGLEKRHAHGKTGNSNHVVETGDLDYAAARRASPCGSMTNFLAAPLSKSLYPCGASSRVMMVALTARAGCTLSCRIAIMSWRL
jgi:hypothetical protein